MQSRSSSLSFKQGLAGASPATDAKENLKFEFHFLAFAIRNVTNREINVLPELSVS
jgi:hypothetical protein